MIVMRLTFDKQVYLGLAVETLSFFASSLTENGVFAKLGVAFFGLLFVVHPVFPTYITPTKRELRLMQGAGIFGIVVGLCTRFGV